MDTVEPPPDGPIDAEAILAALPMAVVAVDESCAVAWVNGAGEQLLCGSAGYLAGQPLSALLPRDNPLFDLIAQVRDDRNAVSGYDVSLESPRIGRHYVNVHAAPLADRPGWVVLTFQERTIADQINRQLSHRGAARSVTAMAAMLAHEVKNPMSGIRGAAQLLEVDVSEDNRALTRLIRDETDRVVALIDRMEAFSDLGPPRREAVNIHQVLDRVRQLAVSGFGRRIRFVEHYDPSLPPVSGDRDQLVQVFLNLVKNAAEALSEKDKEGEVALTTAYRHGVRFAVAGSESRVHLPLMVSVEDNGPGIPEDIQPYLFDPFVTTKPKGSGLGLALVAKVVGDHGGVVEFESRPRRTVFRVMLPMYHPLAREGI